MDILNLYIGFIENIGIMFSSTHNQNSHVSVNGVNPFFQSSANVHQNVIFLLNLGEYLQPDRIYVYFWEDTV